MAFRGHVREVLRVELPFRSGDRADLFVVVGVGLAEFRLGRHCFFDFNEDSCFGLLYRLLLHENHYRICLHRFATRNEFPKIWNKETAENTPLRKSDTYATIQSMETKNISRYLLTVDGNALTKARMKKGLSLEKMVQRLSDGLNKSTVSRWEQSVLNPSPERLWKLVDILGTQNFIRLNGKAVLTAEEIEVVRKMREG